RDVSFSFPLPDVEEKEVLEMAVTLWKENKGWQKVREETYRLSLFPKTLKPSLPLLILGDPARFPFPATVIREINSVQPFSVVVVARQLSSREANDLLAKVEEGCKALILESSPPLTELLKLSFNSYSAKRAFAPFQHPILRDIEERELSFWRGGKVAKGGYTPPILGTSKPLIFCGAGDVCLLEIKRGKGTIILSEMDILNQINQEPLALFLFVKCVEYLHSLPLNDYPKAGIFARPDSPLTRTFTALGLEAPLIKEADLQDFDIVIATGRSLPSATALKEFFSRGGTLLLLAPSTESEKTLNELLPSPIKSIPYRDEVQLIRAGKEKLTEGIYLDWLFWLERGRSRSIVNRYFEGPIKPLLVTPLTDWRKWCWQGENVKTAGILK
ncbi:MAG: hypothetical protein NZ900_09725, partial [Synergistetes bacterium]|nr:hypothetical protein [Synergistota bacterium]MDW8193193.1 hypothetical protein [Synergistota bacterium]